jgi:serralysin
MYTPSELALLRAMDPNAVIPGIDTAVGNLLPAASLKSVTSISTSPYAGIRYIPSENEIVITQAGAVLDGYNFGNTEVVIAANNVTIENSTFQAAGSELFCVRQYTGYTGATIENDTFTGGSAGNTLPLQAFVLSTGTSINVLNNSMINAPGDAIDAWGGTFTGNYISGGGFSSKGTHPDGIWITNSQSPTLISNNFIDWTWANGATNNSNGTTNNAVRITSEEGNVSNVTVTNNILLGGEYTIDAGNAGSGTFSNIQISNNFIGFGAAGDFIYGPQAGVTKTANTIIGFNNPVYSSNAWNAYQAQGLGTAHLIVASAPATIVGASTGSSTLYGNGTTENMLGTANETIFIGGAGKQWLLGGAGPNIFRYLAFSDSQPISSDAIGYFNVSKDVIDLSRIDANPALAGLQNLQFIGSGNFTSAGGEMRVVQDVAHNITYVQATMAGSTTPVFQIALNGLLNLTAANFALTASQANLLNHDTATYYANGKVKTSLSFLTNGSSLAKTFNTDGSYEVTQNNTAGQNVSETIYSKTATELASQVDATGAGTLTLDATGLTVALGSSPSVNYGVDSFSLPTHPSEQIAMNGQTGETFTFTQGFGQDTLSGYAATANMLQLSSAMFSYLNAGMTQAQDLAAVLAHSSSTSSGLVISDSYGDTLTISTGISLTDSSGNTQTAGQTTAATLAAAASNIKFI